MIRTGLIALVLAMLLAPAAEAVTFPVTIEADTADGICDSHCSLREAINAANMASGPDVVTVPAGAYTLSLQGAGEDGGLTGDLDITESLTITGAGARGTVVAGRTPTDLSSVDRVFDVLSGTVEISELMVARGSAFAAGDDFGGAIYNQGALTLRNVWIAANHAEAGGGGVASDGPLTVSGSLFQANDTDVSGGAIDSAATLTIANSTLVTNRADENGGGINVATDSTSLTNVTFDNNFAGSAFAGRDIYNDASTTVTNTIFASSATTPSNCGGAPLTSGGHNIDNGTSCGLAASGDRSSTDPRESIVGDRGGPTDTVGLSESSPAIDAGLSAACPASDQRGFPRPMGPACDIGAFEFPYSDLALSMSAAPAEPRAGQDMSLTATVTNLGPVAIPGDIQLFTFRPPALRAVSLTATAGSCLGFSPFGPTFLCLVPGLAPGASASAELVLRISEDHTNPAVTGRASLGSLPPGMRDSNPANNSTSLTVRVLLLGACANVFQGGPGADVLNGTPLGDRLRGGDGGDRLDGKAGEDCLVGEAGADTMLGAGGRDRLEGGTGNDRMSGGAGNDRLSGGTGKDRQSGGAGSDRQSGGPGADSLAGAAGRDSLDGGPGADSLNGGRGSSVLVGRGGNDRISSVNRARDRINCGPGRRDQVRADAQDLLRGCELVTRAGP